MIKSMTGFGRASLSNEKFEIRAEIKSVNSKYCDLNIRIPKMLAFMEIPLRSRLSEKLMRGKAELTVDIRFIKPVQKPVLNKSQFESALGVLEQMKTEGGLTDNILLEHLLRFPDLIDYESVQDTKELEETVFSLVDESIAVLDGMRAAEGLNMERAVDSLLSTQQELLVKVNKEKDAVFKHWKERFEKRLEELKNGICVDDRAVQEAAIYAERANIQEEIDRLLSHIKQFVHIMKNEYPCGKKLDFLCQEMYREWNTIASKSIKTEIINSVVEAKAAVDSIREQIQNIV